MVRLLNKKIISLLMILLATLFLSACGQSKTNPETTAVTTESQTEPQTEPRTEPTTVADAPKLYFEASTETESVIALRSLDPADYPKPFGTQMTSYDQYVFYEVLIVTPENEEMQVAYIHAYKPSHIEDVYRKLAIRYEDNHAIYKYDNDYYVVSLVGEPRLFTTPAPFYDVRVDKETESEGTLYIAGNQNSELHFKIVENRFDDGGQHTFEFWADSYDWTSKTIIHMPADQKTLQITRALTDDPDLLKVNFGGSTEQLFDSLGTPISKGWILGDYLAYEDMMVYSMVDEARSQLSLYPIKRVNYYGEHAVSGIKIGMSFEEVEAIIGPPEQLIFGEGSESFYPFTISHVVDQFHIQIDFNTNLVVNDFSIIPLIDDEEGDPEALKAYYQSILDESKATADSLVREGALMSHLNQVTYAYDHYNAVYFTVENDSKASSGDEVGLYRYDMSTLMPVKLTDQPMAIVFEISEAINPSIIALGLDDGVLYQIDINSRTVKAVSGPNYKEHYPIYGGVILDLGGYLE